MLFVVLLFAYIKWEIEMFLTDWAFKDDDDDQ